MKKILIFPFSGLWLAMSTVFVCLNIAFIQEFIIEAPEKYQFFCYGFIVYILITIVIKTDQNSFFNTHVHEIQHYAGLLVFPGSKPSKLMVSEQPENNKLGYFKYRFNSNLTIIQIIREHIVSLAPYYLPIFCIPLLVIYCLVQPSKSSWYFAEPDMRSLLFLLGFCYGFHSKLSYLTARPEQGDFQHLGFIYSILFCISMQLMFLFMTIFIITYQQGSLELLFENLDIISESALFFFNWIGSLIT